MWASGRIRTFLFETRQLFKPCTWFVLMCSLISAGVKTQCYDVVYACLSFRQFWLEIDKTDLTKFCWLQYTAKNDFLCRNWRRTTTLKRVIDIQKVARNLHLSSYINLGRGMQKFFRCFYLQSDMRSLACTSHVLSVTCESAWWVELGANSMLHKFSWCAFLFILNWPRKSRNRLISECVQLDYRMHSSFFSVFK